MRRIQGQIDTPLNDLGRTQAARNGAALAELNVSLSDMPFVASPLTRCRETMEIVQTKAGVTHGTYTTDDRLKEIHFGTWQEQTWPEVPDFDPQGHAARQADPFNWTPAGGESYADLTARVAEWLDTVTENTVCVAHGGVSRVLRGYVLNLPKQEIPELPVPQDRILLLSAGQMAWA